MALRDSPHLVYPQSTWNFHSLHPTSPGACANPNVYCVAKGSYEITVLKQMTEYLETTGVKLTNMSSLALLVFTSRNRHLFSFSRSPLEPCVIYIYIKPYAFIHYLI